MKTTVSLLKSPKPEFVFRGDALAAGGFITKLNNARVPLDTEFTTTNGESRLPMIGGVSRSLVEAPNHRFPDFLNYGRCETSAVGKFVEGNAVTTLTATVENVHMTTSPSADDKAEGVRAIAFHADKLSIALESTHPQKGAPRFEFSGEPEARGLFLAITDSEGQVTTLPIEVVFDERLLKLCTLKDLDDEFLGNREFFEEHSPRFPTRAKLVFGRSRIPRTSDGYVFGSIVKQLSVGGDVVRGSMLTRKGFGTIRFGVMVANTYSRRIALAHVSMGSETGAEADYACVESNGIWK